jgi:hypothetical protein
VQPDGRGKRQWSVSLIDLGEVGFDEEPEPSTPPAPRWLRRLGVPGWRKAAAAAVLASAAGGLAGTAPATVPEPAVRVLDGVTSQSSLSIAGDTLLRVGGDAMVLTATDLPTGAILWSSMIGQTVFRLDALADSVAVQTGPTPGFEVVVPSPENMMQALARGHLTVLDARTGVQRWRHAGALVGPFGIEGSLVMLVPSENVTGAFSGWFLVGVERNDGHDLWTRPLPDGTQWILRHAGPEPDRIDPTTVTVVGPDGSLSAVDTLAGRSTPIGRLPAGSTLEWSWMDLIGIRRPDPYAPGDPSRSPDPDGVDQRPQRFEVYSLATMDAPLWGMPLGPGQPDTVPTPCQENVLCALQPDAVNRIDARTGRPVAFPDVSIPSSIGIWRTRGGVLGTSGGDPAAAIAFVPPAASKTKEGWLGLVRMRQSAPEVVPLTRIPISIEECGPATEQWIVCPGMADAIVLSQSDVRAMIAAVPRGGRS